MNQNFDNFGNIVNNENDENDENGEKKGNKFVFIIGILIVIILGLGQLVYLIIGSIYLYQDSEIKDSEFDECRGNMIYASTLAVITTTSILFVAHRNRIISGIAGLVTFGFNIWSIIEYAWVTDDCENLFKDLFPHLFTFFEATAILSMLYISFLSFACVCLCFCFCFSFAIFAGKNAQKEKFDTS
eukprot:TRINITY_DN320_c0_g2_i1.p1 TRINITY_DN320_c0_g2~~TRINITY_DN320_c0_g2_i1.p1  ORF type:complete len:186 (+),score=56.23 TRINITY_DN320_c0_g2_i1:154-711(+)